MTFANWMLTVKHAVYSVSYSKQLDMPSNNASIQCYFSFTHSLCCFCVDLFVHSIVRLNLSCNGVGSVGSSLIANALLENRHLTSLDMSGNPVGDPGGIALMQTLNYHDCPREIFLKDSTYPEREKSAVQDLRYPTGIFTLDLTKMADR
jgi:hypothetical protein